MADVNYPLAYSKLRGMEHKAAVDSSFLQAMQPLKAFFSEKKRFWAHSDDFSSRVSFAVYVSAGVCYDVLDAVEKRFFGTEAAQQDKKLVSSVFNILPVLEKTQNTITSLESMSGIKGPSFFYERVIKDLETQKKELLSVLKALRAG